METRPAHRAPSAERSRVKQWPCQPRWRPTKVCVGASSTGSPQNVDARLIPSTLTTDKFNLQGKAGKIFADTLDCHAGRPSRSNRSGSLLPRASRGRRAGDEGAVPPKTCSRPRRLRVGTRGDVRRSGPDARRDADCLLTPDPSPPEAGGEGRKNGSQMSAFGRRSAGM